LKTAEDSGAQHSHAQIIPRGDRRVDVRRGQALLSLAHRLWRHEAREADLVEAHESDEDSVACLDAHIVELSTEGCGTRGSVPVRGGLACQACRRACHELGLPAFGLRLAAQSALLAPSLQ